MSRLTIAVHNKAGLYVHRGSLVANVPGGQHERRGLRSSADRQFYVSVNPPVIPTILMAVATVRLGKGNSLFVMVLQFLSNFVCVLITLQLEHMQKGRLRNIEEHFQNRVSSRGFL